MTGHAQERATRQTYLTFGSIAAVLAFLLALSVLGGDVGLAVVAGLLLMVAVVNLRVTRKHGALGRKRPAWGPDALAKRYRVAAMAVAAIGLALVAYGALYAIDGQPVPAIAIGVVCAGLVFLISWTAYVNARFVDDVAAAMACDQVRLVCIDLREPWRRDQRPGALVLTPARVVSLQASGHGVSEVASLPISEIQSVDANFLRGSLTLQGNSTELGVRRAAPVQVQALFEALREAGVSERTVPSS